MLKTGLSALSAPHELFKTHTRTHAHPYLWIPLFPRSKWVWLTCFQVVNPQFQSQADWIQGSCPQCPVFLWWNDQSTQASGHRAHRVCQKHQATGPRLRDHTGLVDSVFSPRLGTEVCRGCGVCKRFTLWVHVPCHSVHILVHWGKNQTYYKISSLGGIPKGTEYYCFIGKTSFGVLELFIFSTAWVISSLVIVTILLLVDNIY